MVLLSSNRSKAPLNNKNGWLRKGWEPEQEKGAVRVGFFLTERRLICSFKVLSKA